MTKMKDSDIATSGLLQVSVTAPDPQLVPATVPDHQDIPAAVADHQADTPQPQNEPSFDGNTTFTTNHDVAQQSQQKLLEELNKCKKKNALLKKKLKASQQKNRRMGKRVTSLQEIVKQLKDNNLISSNCEEMLSQTFSGVPLAVKVNLAAQSLSSSVADAIEYCATILKLPQFQGSEATVKFLRMFDHLFDVLNSRNPRMLSKGRQIKL